MIKSKLKTSNFFVVILLFFYVTFVILLLNYLRDNKDRSIKSNIKKEANDNLPPVPKIFLKLGGKVDSVGVPMTTRYQTLPKPVVDIHLSPDEFYNEYKYKTTGNDMINSETQLTMLGSKSYKEIYSRKITFNDPTEEDLERFKEDKINDMAEMWAIKYYTPYFNNLHEVKEYYGNKFSMIQIILATVVALFCILNLNKNRNIALGLILGSFILITHKIRYIYYKVDRLYKLIFSGLILFFILFLGS